MMMELRLGNGIGLWHIHCSSDLNRLIPVMVLRDSKMRYLLGPIMRHMLELVHIINLHAFDGRFHSSIYVHKAMQFRVQPLQLQRNEKSKRMFRRRFIVWISQLKKKIRFRCQSDGFDYFFFTSILSYFLISRKQKENNDFERMFDRMRAAIHSVCVCVRARIIFAELLIDAANRPQPLLIYY